MSEENKMMEASPSKALRAIKQCRERWKSSDALRWCWCW